MEKMPPATLIILVVTIIATISAWRNPQLTARFIFNPFFILRRKEYHRLFTSGFLHSNYMHLIFNMYAFYLFGKNLEFWFIRHYGKMGGSLLFALLYCLMLVFAEVWPLIKYRRNDAYQALGASGGVSGVVFAMILLAPTQGIGLLFVPGVFMPGFLLGSMYLVYSFWAAQNRDDNIGHEAHFSGAVSGVVFMLLLQPELALEFVDKFRSWDLRIFIY